MKKLVSKTTGKLLIALGSVGFPASICLMFVIPMIMVGVLASLGGDPSSHNIGPYMYVGNLVFWFIELFCFCASPLLAIAGLVIYLLADQQEKQPPNRRAR